MLNSRLLENSNNSQYEDPRLTVNQKASFVSGNNRESILMADQDQNKPVQSYGSSEKEEFIQNFGIKYGLPASQIIEAAFYPKDPSVLVVLITYNNFEETVMNTEDMISDEIIIQETDDIIGEMDHKFRGSDTFMGESQRNDFASSVLTTERKSRLSAIIFMQESNHTYKILNEKILNYQINGLAKFSNDGSLFIYKQGADAKEFTLVDSSSIESLIRLKELTKVQKHVFEDVVDIKFNNNNSVVALIYKKGFDTFDITNPSLTNIPAKTQYNIQVGNLDVYEQILGFFFKLESPKQGYLALLPKIMGLDIKSIHIVPFNETKINNIGLIDIKINFPSRRVNYDVEFYPGGDKVVVCAKSSAKIHTKGQNQQITVIYDLKERIQAEVPNDREINKICTIKDFGDQPMRPFCTLNSNAYDKNCILVMEEKKKLVLDYHFDKDNTKIIQMDARFERNNNNLVVRVAFLKDQEKLQVFTFSEEFSGFDQIQSMQSKILSTSKKATAVQDEQKKMKGVMHYREFQEYKLCNFEFPYLAYIDMSRSIVVHFLDKSSESIRVQMPTQKRWAIISKAKICDDQKLSFLVEDVKEIFLYEYDLTTKQLSNQGNPLVSIHKDDFEEGSMISDFWAHTVKSKAQSKNLFQQVYKVDTAFYFTTFPKKSLVVIYSINNMPEQQEIDYKINSVVVKHDDMYYSSAGKFISYLNYKKLKLENKLLYKETDGQILQMHCCNSEDRVWILVEQDKQHILKHIELGHEATDTALLSTINIKDQTFINYMLKSYENGYIEESQNSSTMLFLSSGTIFSLDSIITDPKRVKPISFGNVICLAPGEQVISSYPQVDNKTLKILYVIKNQKTNIKRALILPSLLCENKLHLSKVDEQNTNQNQFITILEPDKADALLPDPNAIYKVNFDHKFYQIVSVKAQILLHGTLNDVVKDEAGKFQAVSPNVRKFISFNAITNTVFIFNTEINLKAMSVKYNQINQIVLPDRSLGSSLKLAGVFNKGLQKTEGKSSQDTMTFHINNNGDVMQVVYNQETKSQDFYIFLASSNPQQFETEKKAGVFVKLNYFSLPQSEAFVPKGTYLSEFFAIVWSETLCRLYDLNQQRYSSLTLELDKKEDNYQFIEIFQAEENPAIFICRIENSPQSHMIIVWNQLTRTEEASSDVAFLSRVLFDENQNAYGLDNDCGIITLTAQGGGCKNLGFRNLLSSEFVSLSKQYLNDEETNQNVDRFRLKMLAGQKVKRFYKEADKATDISSRNIFLGFGNDQVQQKVVIKYIKYIINQKEVSLPYSYLQLVVKEALDKIKNPSTSSRNQMNEYEDILNGLQMSVFTYQIRNSTILHNLASNYKELSLCLSIFNKRDPALLDMLLIQDEFSQTPLEIAINSKNPRCVNLIMTMIAKGCQETFGKCTNLIQKHFAQLINYVSFKEFIESTFYKSEQYLQITSIAAKNLDELDNNGILMPHNTVVKDKLFNQIFIDPYSKVERNVDVNALRADWILKSVDGSNFLKELSQSDDMELFNSEAIKTIVMFLWQDYKSKIIKYLFFPFLIYSFLFTLQFTILPPYYDQIEQIDQEPSTPISNYNEFMLELPSYAVVPFLLYFMLFEMRQLYIQGTNYFFDPWNILDSTSIVTNMFVTIYSIYSDADGPFVRIIAACTIIILYMKFFYFLRIFENTSTLIRMIVQISYDIRFFICIFCLAIIGFGNGIYIIHRSQTDAELATIQTLGQSIFSVYNMALGNSDPTYDGMNGEYILYILFIISSLLIMILLLNMLIAIMGDTFGNVKQIEEQAKIREYLQLIMDNDFLIDRKNYYRDVKYIISVTIDKEKKIAGGATQEQSQFSNDTIMQYIDQKFEYLQKVQDENHIQIIKTLSKMKGADQMGNVVGGLKKMETTQKQKSTLPRPSLRPDNSLFKTVK